MTPHGEHQKLFLTKDGLSHPRNQIKLWTLDRVFQQQVAEAKPCPLGEYKMRRHIRAPLGSAVQEGNQLKARGSDSDLHMDAYVPFTTNAKAKASHSHPQRDRALKSCSVQGLTHSLSNMQRRSDPPGS